eukprot:TRINITY_DN9102_c0_g1_i1.p1 TRINITY_DN9102_c0_g1~~TRINITY_DN9102_c0_g1_i1.p1  ORF type:complete len:102 (-),score=15.74 TRINITY_DN9102_c0_g1_i1:26-331(-)
MSSQETSLDESPQLYLRSQQMTKVDLLQDLKENSNKNRNKRRQNKNKKGVKSKILRENPLLPIRRRKQIALCNVPRQSIREYSIPKIQQISTVFERTTTLS